LNGRVLHVQRRLDEISNVDRIDWHGRGIARWVCIQRLLARLAPAPHRFLRHLRPRLAGTVRLSFSMRSRARKRTAKPGVLRSPDGATTQVQSVTGSNHAVLAWTRRAIPIKLDATPSNGTAM
jgi:hypothetical protein